MAAAHRAAVPVHLQAAPHPAQTAVPVPPQAVPPLPVRAVLPAARPVNVTGTVKFVRFVKTRPTAGDGKTTRAV